MSSSPVHPRKRIRSNSHQRGFSSNMKRSGRPRKKDGILEGRPFFSPEAQLKPWSSDSPGKRFQPEPKKPRLKMDALLSRFLVFGLAPRAISGSDRIHNAMSALASKPRRTKGPKSGGGKRRWRDGARLSEGAIQKAGKVTA